MLHLIFLKIAGIIQGVTTTISERLSRISAHNEKLVSQNFTFLGGAMSLNQGICISFQLKSPMWCHETGRTARISSMQDVNMSPERATRQFTLFVAV